MFVFSTAPIRVAARSAASRPISGTISITIPRTVLGRRIVETYQLMRNGALTPERVVQAVVAYSPQALLGKIFADHRRLHDLG
jgi:hypothetical protein